jgi:formylglycine-generating enzyme required for sulfatase activity
MKRRSWLVGAVLVASATAAWAVACSTRDYALCIEHPEEDPARCGDGGGVDATPDRNVVGEGGADADGGCPSDMVPVPVAKGFCIDKTEATVADYGAFLDAGPKASNGPLCGWKAKPGDFIPHSRWDKSGPDDAGVPGQLTPGREKYPVLDVDWCDAYEYCASRGKHLCGRIGGGPVSEDDDGGEWFAACTHGDDGFFTYPWGNDKDAGANCNGAQRAESLGKSPALEKVASLQSCEGPYPNLFDMLGNAAEWVDTCAAVDPNDASVDLCNMKGGSFRDKEYLVCRGASGKGSRNGDGNPVPQVGIRCCK